jgi:hypothetical protein
MSDFEDFKARLAASRARLEQRKESNSAALAKIDSTESSEEQLRKNRSGIIRNNSLAEYLRKRDFDLCRAGANFVTNACPVAIHKPDHRPVTIDTAKELWCCHDHKVGGSVIDWVMHERNVTAGEAMRLLGGNSNAAVIVKTYDYTDAKGKLVYQICRYVPKKFKARRPDGEGGWIWNLERVKRVLYHLPAVIAGQEVCLPEGEKDADDLVKLGFLATTNPFGAGKWEPQYSETLRAKDVVLFGDVGDEDHAGEEHTALRIASLSGGARTIKSVTLPDGFHDVSDYIAALELEHKDARQAIRDLIDETPLLDVESAPTADEVRRADETGDVVTLEDFHAYMPQHKYIFIETRDLWPSSSVNSRLPPLGKGDDAIAASTWLDKNRAVEAMTWAPGLPMLIENRLISDGGWIDRRGCKTFNLYRPPNIELGDPNKAGRWVEHVSKLYPNDVDHITQWLAHRVQRPHEKINHALFLGGNQGIGKDTLLYPVKYAIGQWNVAEILPPTLLARFNGFVKSVILCVNEAHDLGDVDRYALYERLKAYTAAPPDVIRVDEKNLREYVVVNVCGVLLTSNYKTSGLYLPADDRRHYVAWSDANKNDFDDGYWRNIYAWYRLGGCRHVAAYLAQLDLSGFNAKAPPPKTNAFWEIVDSNCAPENAELTDALDQLDNPDAVTIRQVIDVLPDTNEFRYWLKDRKNSRQIPHRFEECGYVAVRNRDEKQGRWKIGNSSHVIYAKKTLSISEQIVAARQCIEKVRSLYPQS